MLCLMFTKKHLTLTQQKPITLTQQKTITLPQQKPLTLTKHKLVTLVQGRDLLLLTFDSGNMEPAALLRPLGLGQRIISMTPLFLLPVMGNVPHSTLQ
jgi:hypothetical protein